MTSGNPILDKNLECIAKYNPKLSEKLLNLPYLTNSIELIETELAEPNLSYNGLPLHDQRGAELEAKSLFDQSQDARNCIHVIFGIGLGHLFKEFCERTVGSVVLYEPNLEILRVTLELVDFSRELSQKNVKVSSDFQELKLSFESVYQYKAEANFLFLNSYEKIYGEETKSILNQVVLIKETCLEDFRLIGDKGFDFISSVVNNLTTSLEATPLGEFKDIYKSKTALIISAGPTLDANIETIKKNRDKFVLFCVGTAFKALADNGITPDFLNMLEMSDCTGQVKGYDLSNINVILEPFVHKNFQALNVKQKFLFPSSSTNGSKYWASLTGLNIDEYTSAGCVSYEALTCAKMLGFSKIILVGQDLAYVDNQCYSRFGAYSDMRYEINPQTNKLEIKIDDRKKFVESCSSVSNNFTRDDAENLADEKIQVYSESSCFIKGISGEMIPTLAAYAVFADLFRAFAYYNEHLELINTSMVGAQIDGFKNIPLALALENAVSVKKIELSSDFQYDKNLILKNLTKEKELVENILKDFENPKEYCFKFDRELKRSNSLTDDARKYLGLLLKSYDEVTMNYFEKIHMYRVISMIESMELKHYVDSQKDSGDLRLKNIYNLLKIYFNRVEEKLVKLLVEISQQKTVLAENISSKSTLIK